MNRYTLLITNLLLIAVLSAHAQGPPTKRVNFGNTWNSWSDYIRDIYLQGLTDGQFYTFTLVPLDSVKSFNSMREKVFLFFEPNVIRDVMTDLYKDPANTFISSAAMAHIARDKLQGKDISKTLRRAREHEQMVTY